MIRLASEADTALSAHYEAMREQGAAGLRAQAWTDFTRQGLPNRRVEAWHYTDLRAALAKPAPIGAAVRAAPMLGRAQDLERAHDSVRLVTLDGAFRPDLSDLAQLPEGVVAQSLREALAQGEAEIMAALATSDVVHDDAVVALNAALMQDGVVLRVAPGTQAARAIELTTLVTAPSAQSVFTRSLAMVGSGARTTLIETVGALSNAAIQDNQALILRLSEGAEIDLVTHIEGGAQSAVRVLSLLARLERGASLNSCCLIEGGGLLRRQIFARLDGEQARVGFNGASLLRGRQHADTTLVIDHAKPHGQSRERFRHILDEQAVGVFQGKVVVRPGAQKTDGVMQSKALMLSDGATMNNKPELEIFADDVVCGHGATCGRLDKEQLFYLMARGVRHEEAEALLVEGFANEAFEALEQGALRDFLAMRVSAWLATRKGER